MYTLHNKIKSSKIGFTNKFSKYQNQKSILIVLEMFCKHSNENAILGYFASFWVISVDRTIMLFG
jgi:hypothetical protein